MLKAKGPIHVHISTEVSFTEAFEPVTDLEDVYLNPYWNCQHWSQVHSTKAFKPMTDFEAWSASILVHVN